MYVENPADGTKVVTVPDGEAIGMDEDELSYTPPQQDDDTDDAREQREEAEKVKPAETEADSDEDADDDDGLDDEAKSYGKNVQKRISKEVRKRRETERELAAERAEKARLAAEVEKFRRMQGQSDDLVIASRGEAFKAELEKAERDYATAYESGDVKALTEAQKVLSRTQFQIMELERVKAGRARAMEQEQQAAPPQAPAQPTLHPETQGWLDRNKDWFHTDHVRASAALAIDKELTSRGVDPKTPEFYRELDRRLRDEFPHKYKQTPKSKAASPVAAASRASAVGTGEGGGRKVPLTLEQQAMAKRLGVPPEEYARYVKVSK